MFLAKLGELACAGRARTEMMDPGLRFLQREFAGGNRFEDLGTRTAFPLGVRIALEERAP